MTRIAILLAAGTAGFAAFPAASQTPYPYPQQSYPQGQYAYPQQGQDVVGQMIGQLLGNRYSANDRYAVERCATAAIAEANERRLSYRYGQGYGDPNRDYDDRNDDYDPDRGYGYPNRNYNRAAMMRVTAITEVLRRQGGVRVSGLLDSRGGYRPYGQAYGYQDQGYQGQGYPNQGYPNQGYPNQGYPNQGYPTQAYAAQGDLTFRCNVDYRGTVTNVRVRRNSAAYRGDY